MDPPVLSPPLLVVLIVPYCGNGRRACATLRVVWMAGFVKFAYGILMPAATAAGELACEFNNVMAPAVPNRAIRSLTADNGTWLIFRRLACRFVPFEPL